MNLADGSIATFNCVLSFADWELTLFQTCAMKLLNLVCILMVSLLTITVQED
jgi:hypothetical protein